MTPFQAMFYNFLSANSMYIGCAIGILAGESPTEARWVYSISGATATYLALGAIVSDIFFC